MDHKFCNKFRAFFTGKDIDFSKQALTILQCTPSRISFIVCKSVRPFVENSCAFKRAQILVLSKSEHTTSKIARNLKFKFAQRLIVCSSVKLSKTFPRLHARWELRPKNTVASCTQSSDEHKEVGERSPPPPQHHIKAGKEQASCAFASMKQVLSNKQKVSWRKKVVRYSRWAPLQFSLMKNYSPLSTIIKNMKVLARCSKKADCVWRVVSWNTQPASMMVWASMSIGFRWKRSKIK